MLPFQNLSKDEENAYFTDGVQDQILTDLAKIADLKVISRTSVMQYKTRPQQQSEDRQPVRRAEAAQRFTVSDLVRLTAFLFYSTINL